MPKPNLVEVPTLPVWDKLDVPQCLRKLADELENGKYGAIGNCVVAVLGNTLEVHAYGPDSAGPSSHLTLCAAARKIERMIWTHGEDSSV